jgi:hypothetical protein
MISGAFRRVVSGQVPVASTAPSGRGPCFYLVQCMLKQSKINIEVSRSLVEGDW